jgi:hypothetical protein
MQVLGESEVSFRAKMKGVFSGGRASEWTAPGVSPDECIRFFGQVMEQIANHIGLKWEQQKKNDTRGG